MDERRLKEFALLERHYGEIERGQNVDWIIIKALKLPHGWSRETTRLLIILPPGYPLTPPDNFYVEPGLTLSSGGPLNNYSEGSSQLSQNWGQFSHHVEPSTWQPAADVVSGDNLLTFMLSVEKRFKELNQWPS